MPLAPSCERLRLVALHRIGNDGLLSDFHIRMLAPFRIDYRLPDGPGSWWCRSFGLLGLDISRDPQATPGHPVAYANGLWIVGVDHKSHHVSNIVGGLATSRGEVLPDETRHCVGRDSRVRGA
jgi:hypothetical protein